MHGRRDCKPDPPLHYPMHFARSLARSDLNTSVHVTDAVGQCSHLISIHGQAMSAASRLAGAREFLCARSLSVCLSDRPP